MFLSHQSVLIDVMYWKFFYFFGEKWETKKNKNKKNLCSVGNEIRLFVSLFTFKGKDELMYFLLDLIPSGLTGLEPAASALTGRCSNQLNYNPQEIKCRVSIFL